ncbi:MAG: hypothetical protein JW938_04505 [Candidatus Omnitrophica bacterium]|nr:hypothetical protein [Candidatus Omnitrophota bacterium]
MIKKLFIIAHLTVRELLSARVVFILAGASLAFFFMLSLINYFDPTEGAKVLHDLGFTLCAFFAFMLILFGVPAVLHSGAEHEQDVLFLSKAVSRSTYLNGKIIGVMSTLTISLGVLIALVLGIIALRIGKITPAVPTAIFLMYIKYVSFAAIMVLIGVLVDKMMAYFLGISVFFFAHGLRSFEMVAYQAGSTTAAALASFLKTILPRYDYFTIVETITLETAVPVAYVLKVTAYACVYSLIVLTAAHVIYARKEF